MLTYVTKVHEYGETIGDADVIEYTGLAGPTFANLLTAVQFLNELGPDVSYDELFAHMTAFAGPMMIQVGPIQCGLAALRRGVRAPDGGPAVPRRRVAQRP